MVKEKWIVTIIFTTAIFSIVFQDTTQAQQSTSDGSLSLSSDWSINATDAETNDLIRQAELLLLESSLTNKNAAAVAAESAIENITGANPQNNQPETNLANYPSPTIAQSSAPGEPVPAVAPSDTTLPQDSPAATQPQKQYNFTPENEQAFSFNIDSRIINWLPGAIAFALSLITAYYVYKQLKHSRRAGRHASTLIAEAKDLQSNIKQWEQNTYNNHLNEIASHIDAMQDTIVTAREVKDSVNDSINKSVILNQKSIDILKRANKELSKSLTSQVSSLEQQLKDTVDSQIDRINSFAQGHIESLKSEKDSLLKTVEEKTSELKIRQNSIIDNIAKHNHIIDDKQQSTTSMIDVITNELNRLKEQNAAKPIIPAADTAKTADKSHADILRESIARQRTAISGSSLFSGGALVNISHQPVAEESDIKEIISVPQDNNIALNTLTDIISDNMPSVDKSSTVRKTMSIQKESTVTTSDGIEIKTRDITPQKTSGKTSGSSGNSKYSELNSKELMDKLTHAEKWHNFKLAAEVCQEMALRSPEKSEVFDIWGQMLARQAATEKGQDSVLLLKEAAQKMQKASLLDNGNYKIFNNWGVILKNLALNANEEQEIEKNLALARRKFETSLSLNPQNHEALNNWGNTLLIQARFRSGAMQESLLKSACEKFAEAVALKPDKDVALYSWGNALFKLANCKTDKELRKNLLVQAQKCWEKANAIKPGIASKELRVIRSMVPPLKNTGTSNGKVVTDYKFKTLSK